MSTLSPLVAPTTYGATSDHQFNIRTTLGFQCLCGRIAGRKYSLRNLLLKMYVIQLLTSPSITLILCTYAMNTCARWDSWITIQDYSVYAPNQWETTLQCNGAMNIILNTRSVINHQSALVPSIRATSWTNDAYMPHRASMFNSSYSEKKVIT